MCICLSVCLPSISGECCIITHSLQMTSKTSETNRLTDGHTNHKPNSRIQEFFTLSNRCWYCVKIPGSVKRFNCFIVFFCYCWVSVCCLYFVWRGVWQTGGPSVAIILKGVLCPEYLQEKKEKKQRYDQT